MVEPVPFARSSPPLTAAAACLRRLADQFDAGQIPGRTVLVVWDDPDAIVAGAVYGEMPDRFGVVGMLKAAADKASTGAWG